MRHINELQRFSVYDITVSRAKNGVQETVLNGQPGLLAEQVYTPIQKEQQKKYYAFGRNDITLNYNGQNVWRIPVQQINGDKSQTIMFNVLDNDVQEQYTRFRYSGLLQLMLFSQRIFINKNDSSWYTWNADYTECTVDHKLNGYIDFIARYNGKQQIYIDNKVIDGNNLQLNIGSFFNKDLVQPLKIFQMTYTAQLTLDKLINLQLYNFSENVRFRIYKKVEEQTQQQYQELERDIALQKQISYQGFSKTKFTFEQGQEYRIYAIVPQSNRTDYIELVVWKISESSYPKYQNVFTYTVLDKDKLSWTYFDNDEQYDLQMPYRFTFLGYTATNTLQMPITDKTHQTFLQGQRSFPDTKTLTTDLCITKQYLYTLTNNRLKVLVPKLYQQDECRLAIIYSSCWAQTYYCDLANQRYTNGTWNTIKNIYKYIFSYYIQAFHYQNYHTDYYYSLLTPNFVLYHYHYLLL